MRARIVLSEGGNWELGSEDGDGGTHSAGAGQSPEAGSLPQAEPPAGSIIQAPEGHSLRQSAHHRLWGLLPLCVVGAYPEPSTAGLLWFLNGQSC